LIVVRGSRSSPWRSLRSREALLSVSAPHYQDVKGKAGAYWLEPAATRDGKPVYRRMGFTEVARYRHFSPPRFPG